MSERSDEKCNIHSLDKSTGKCWKCGVASDEPNPAPSDFCYFCDDIGCEKCKPTPEPSAREFNKVDRALELQVIDWLQWGEFPERLDKPSMPALALELIAKRKAALEAKEAQLTVAHKALQVALNYSGTMLHKSETCKEVYQTLERGLQESKE